MSNDLITYNENGLLHGYYEQYYHYEKIMRKGYFVNGEQTGYWEAYHYDGKLSCKAYYIR